MQNTPNCDDDVLEFDAQKHLLNKAIPLKPQQHSIDTKRIRDLRTKEQANNKETPFDRAVRKQQQLFTICNTLERQNSLLLEINELIDSERGALWLDSQIKELKMLCPSDILLQLSKPPCATSARGIENSEIINLNFFNLINEIFYIPLNALSTIETAEMTDQERKDWFEWCLKIDQQLVIFKVQIRSAQSFFNIKSFDKICYLAKDKSIQKQLGKIKHLFQKNSPRVDCVEYNE